MQESGKEKSEQFSAALTFMASIMQSRNDLLHSSCHGRLDFNDTVIHDVPNPETFLRRAEGWSPWNGTQAGVILPWFNVRERLHVGFDTG